jgi:hypothetical protein
MGVACKKRDQGQGHCGEDRDPALTVKSKEYRSQTPQPARLHSPYDYIARITPRPAQLHGPHNSDIAVPSIHCGPVCPRGSPDGASTLQLQGDSHSDSFTSHHP